MATQLYCKVPTRMNYEKLKEIVGNDIISAMNIYFACNPKKTKFKINGKNSIRKLNGKYTIHCK